FDIAEYKKAEILLLHVMNSPGVWGKLFGDRRAQLKVERKLQLVVEEWSKLGKKISYSVKKGVPAKVILSVSDSLKTMAIIMVKSDSNEEEELLSTTARTVISGASCPVILIPGHHISGSWKIENIVLPMDLSLEIPETLELPSETSNLVGNAILLGRYFHSPVHLVGVVSGGVTVEKSNLYKRIEKVHSVIEYFGVTCTSATYAKSQKKISAVVLEHAEKVHGDLILIKPIQKAQFSKNQIGQTAESILNESSIPVLTFSVKAMHKLHQMVQFIDPFSLMGKEEEISDRRFKKLINLYDKFHINN
ncbi:MAG: universal stress protein, partial [Bacteroidales bacterium]|nr:universal stress protein [Bacteroidales bacterium]